MSQKANFNNVREGYLTWVNSYRDLLDDKANTTTTESSSNTNSSVSKLFYSDCKAKYGNHVLIKDIDVKNTKIHKLAAEIYNLKMANDSKMAEEFFEDLLNTYEVIDSMLIAAQEELNIGIIDEEEILQNNELPVVWDKSLKLHVDVDAQGWIVFANNNFVAVSGYQDIEAIGKKLAFNHSNDMPKVIYNYMIDGIKLKEVRPTIIKFTAKDGKYFWALATYKLNLNAGGAIETVSFDMTGLNQNMVEAHVVPLYTKLKYIEDNIDLDASVRYLRSYLVEQNRSYEDFIENLIKTGTNEPNNAKKGVFGAALKMFNL